MGVFEGITHSEEIQELLSSAESMYNSATERLESQKKKTADSLEKLGQLKLQAWSGDMSDFLDRFGAFANVQMKCIDDENMSFVGEDLSPNQLMLNMHTASVNASEVLKEGALSIGTGALVGIASYGGAMMFAKASTGTAIATLSGAAKTNATLAWFGGGSIKSGGMGMLGGKVVLAGIVLAPIALVAGAIASSKGKARLAEAKKIHAEAESAVAKLETVTSGIRGIEKISNGYIELLNGLSKKFKPFLNELNSIAKDYTPDSDGKIDFNKLSEMEQKTLHLSWLLAQLYYHSLSKPILTEDGKVDPEARNMLTYSKKEYMQLSADVTNLSSEKEKIQQNLKGAKTTLSNALKLLEKQRKEYKDYFIKQGREAIRTWHQNISPFASTLSKFENIDVKNELSSKCFNMNIDDAFEHIFAVTDASKKIQDGSYSISEAALIDVSIEGIGSLEHFVQDGAMTSEATAELSETAKWIQYGFKEGQDLTALNILNNLEIENANSLIKGITGKENLSASEYILSEVSAIDKKINELFSILSAGQKTSPRQAKILHSFLKKISLYREEIEKIHQRYLGITELVDYEKLNEDERIVIKMACNFVMVYYYLSNSYLLDDQKNTGRLTMNVAIEEARKERIAITKAAFNMSGSGERAANVLWAPEAQKMAIVNWAFIAIFACIVIGQFVNGVAFGLLGLVGILIAVPRFFYFKNLRESQLWLWRIVRLVVGLFVVILGLILGAGM